MLLWGTEVITVYENRLPSLRKERKMVVKLFLKFIPGFAIPPFLLASIIPVAIAISPIPFNSQNRIIWTSEMRSKRVPKLVQFWDLFLRGFGPQNGPQNCSKIGQTIDNCEVHFWIPFFEALELLGCLLGAFLGFLRLFWDASGPQKP